MRHAGLAISLMPGSDHVRDIDGNGGLAFIGKQQHIHPVIELVLGDAFNRSDLGLSDTQTAKNNQGNHERPHEIRLAPETYQRSSACIRGRKRFLSVTAPTRLRGPYKPAPATAAHLNATVPD